MHIDSKRSGDWTPDEVLLTIEAYKAIARGGNRQSVIAALAAELHRAESAVSAALDALRTVDGASAAPDLSRVARALAEALWSDESEIRRQSAAVRSLWKQRKNVQPQAPVQVGSESLEQAGDWAKGSDRRAMEEIMKEDVLCGNAQCGHPRHEHKDDKRCGGSLATKRNIHGEVEEGEQCGCT